MRDCRCCDKQVEAETPDNGRAAAILRTAGEPTRHRILRVLLCGPRTVSEIVRIMGAPQSLVSHHLGVLRRSWLVAAERHGPFVRYRLARPEIGELLELADVLAQSPRSGEGDVPCPDPRDADR